MPQLDFLVCYIRMWGTVILDMCYLKKLISSDITAFEPGTLASLLVEHVGNVTGFLDDFNRRKDFWQFFRLVIHAEIGKKLRVWHVQAF